MKQLYRQIDKVENSKHSLISAQIQLDLLARLLSNNAMQNPSEFQEDSDVIDELEDIFYLVHLVMDKVSMLYKCVSIELQLPGHGARCHSNSHES